MQTTNNNLNLKNEQCDNVVVDECVMTASAKDDALVYSMQGGNSAASETDSNNNIDHKDISSLSNTQTNRKSVVTNQDNEWVCNLCTFINKPLYLTCEMCGEGRSSTTCTNSSPMGAASVQQQEQHIHYGLANLVEEIDEEDERIREVIRLQKEAEEEIRKENLLKNQKNTEQPQPQQPAPPTQQQQPQEEEEEEEEERRKQLGKGVELSSIQDDDEQSIYDQLIFDRKELHTTKEDNNISELSLDYMDGSNGVDVSCRGMDSQTALPMAPTRNTPSVSNRPGNRIARHTFQNSLERNNASRALGNCMDKEIACAYNGTGSNCTSKTSLNLSLTTCITSVDVMDAMDNMGRELWCEKTDSEKKDSGKRDEGDEKKPKIVLHWFRKKQTAEF